MGNAKTLKVKALLENVPVAIDFVTQSAKASGLDDQSLYQVRVAVDEVCANIVYHAYKGMEPGEMEISCDLDDQAFVVRVRDWGNAFDPDTVVDPDLNAPLEDRALGGLGLFLVRQFMDQVRFTFDPELGNELVMTKRLQVAG
ncbi:ATP-binding protein [Chloroflexota bacterium]